MDWMIVGSLVLIVYCLPSLLAHVRRHRQASAIRKMNLLLGWTVVGWAATMVWVFSSPKDWLKADPFKGRCIRPPGFGR